jgi:hypothetical protein
MPIENQVRRNRGRKLTETMGEIQIYDDRQAIRISKSIKLYLGEDR